MVYFKFIILAIILFYLIQRMFPAKGVRNISTEELKNELKNKNKEFVDVRTQAEFKGNHIRGFKNIPLHQLNQKIKILSKEKEIIVICQSGMRSNKACKILKKHGYKNVSNVKGGMNAWTY
ncbi:rhodanese-like domain-containing protein [Bacillus sp. FJAT-49736]|uniref:rhodanese-like domain-containing protein n=1 Tax=Bacillus sp. FJAT-49736 TaxID=2833582 RepID=UPI001BC92693|nr:rhodanese-like domain-containing protein [Bacillus sp. FJAT-49736]MBS4174494.1 rhodanese-like domain-containing protein [Bacillus sp. FJAT-49736]